jgi:hypothetical protein
MVEHIRSVIGEQEFTLVFDRGSYSPKAFRRLREDKVHIITYRRKPFEHYPASAFSRQTCEFKGERRGFDLYETSVHLKEFGPVRNIAVLRERPSSSYGGLQTPPRLGPLPHPKLTNPKILPVLTGWW